MFNRIKFGAVWRLRKKAYVLGDYQVLRLVPACLIYLHNDQELAEILGHFL